MAKRVKKQPRKIRRIYRDHVEYTRDKDKMAEVVECSRCGALNWLDVFECFFCRRIMPDFSYPTAI